MVSDPSNWRANARSVTKFGTLAQDLGITDTKEFKEFDEVAQQLVAFGTTWMSKIETSQMDKLERELSTIAKKVQQSGTQATLSTKVSTNGIEIGGGATTRVSKDSSLVDNKQIQTEASAAVKTSVDSLGVSEANDFGKLFAKAQAAYRALRLTLRQQF